MITWSVGFMFCNRVRLSLPTHPFTCLLNFWKLNTKSYYARGGNECPVRILSVRPSNFISQNCFSGILHLDIGPIVNVQWVGPNLHARPYLKVITSLNLYSQDLFSVSRKCTSLATFFFFFCLLYCHPNPPHLLGSLTGLKMVQPEGRTSSHQLL